jgi:monothiol glutaredoxin
MNQEIQNKIEKILNNNPIVLFMKGTKEMPMCGFSRQAVMILNDLGVEFYDVNVLEDEELRTGLKEYSSWPTFPQLYVNTTLIGGCDIMTEMYESGELQKLFEK